MRVLLIDDSQKMRTVQRKVLAALAPHVEFAEAADGLEALGLIDSDAQGFDVVLVDWYMPNMDGLTLVRRLRARGDTTPLVMVSTESDKSRVIDAVRAGVNCYVVKPFTPSQLIERVCQTIARARSAQQIAGAVS
jgi:two-component system chemotaxis response regulator CheY